MKKIYLALGSNLGKRKKNLLLAVKLLEHEGLFKTSQVNFSKVYETEALTLNNNQTQNKYLNAALSFENTNISPSKLLEITQKIERKIGRKREKESARFESRLIDIDILFFKGKAVKQENLVIPHPEISKRMFVLKPLLDLGSGLIHPEHQKSIKQIFEECKDKLKVNYFCEWEGL